VGTKHRRPQPEPRRSYSKERKIEKDRLADTEFGRLRCLPESTPGDFDAWIAAPFYRIPTGIEPTVAHIECECRQGRSVTGETKTKVKMPRRLDFFSLLMQASRCVTLLEITRLPTRQVFVFHGISAGSALCGKVIPA
jgi:hypothetical protein